MNGIHPYNLSCLLLYLSRSLYDDSEQDDFLVSLQTRIKQHEKDIERMCNKNYQVRPRNNYNIFNVNAICFN